MSEEDNPLEAIPLVGDFVGQVAHDWHKVVDGFENASSAQDYLDATTNAVVATADTLFPGEAMLHKYANEAGEWANKEFDLGVPADADVFDPAYGRQLADASQNSQAHPPTASSDDSSYPASAGVPYPMNADGSYPGYEDHAYAFNSDTYSAVANDPSDAINGDSSSTTADDETTG